MWRVEDTAEALKAGYLAEKYGLVRTRLHEPCLSRSGQKLAEVSKVMGVRYRSMPDWLAWYRSGGLVEVAARKHGWKGSPRLLTPEQERALAEEASTGRFRTSLHIRDWIQSEHGVRYETSSVYEVLIRLRCALGVPKPGT